MKFTTGITACNEPSKYELMFGRRPLKRATHNQRDYFFSVIMFPQMGKGTDSAWLNLIGRCIGARRHTRLISHDDNKQAMFLNWNIIGCHDATILL
ncbi:hypothetical protein TNIN_368831 [Trichonephila inaurata madagascariensis]|uniref:Uncharacterized protein n=1 Tax=Trichonephila inaurata madagascariensis TaxID=2747483 RepID=A0A8X6XSZ5_9ARAC|nr:hypothetical protein TNIN_368831 [Trichonephila inaurata madagascariensis]